MLLEANSEVIIDKMAPQHASSEMHFINLLFFEGLGCLGGLLVVEIVELIIIDRVSLILAQDPRVLGPRVEQCSQLLRGVPQPDVSCVENVILISLREVSHYLMALFLNIKLLLDIAGELGEGLSQLNSEGAGLNGIRQP